MFKFTKINRRKNIQIYGREQTLECALTQCCTGVAYDEQINFIDIFKGHGSKVQVIDKLKKNQTDHFNCDVIILLDHFITLHMFTVKLACSEFLGTPVKTSL